MLDWIKALDKTILKITDADFAYFCYPVLGFSLSTF